MNQTVKTELQKVLAAYRAQESEVERQAVEVAEFRRELDRIDTEIEAVKTALATVPGQPEVDIGVIRALAAERRQTESRLEQLGWDRAKISARMRNADRLRRAMEQELKESQQQCWKALFDDLKASIDAEALAALLVAGLQAGLTEATVHKAILPSPANRSIVADQLRKRFALPG